MTKQFFISISLYFYHFCMFYALPLFARHYSRLFYALIALFFIAAPVLTSCKSTPRNEREAMLRYVSATLLDKVLQEIFGDSARLERNDINLQKDVSIDLIKQKIIKNKEFRDFLSRTGGLTFYSTDREFRLSWERTPENHVRIKFYYHFQPAEKNGTTSLRMPLVPKKRALQIVEAHREACRKEGYAFFEGAQNVNLHSVRKDGAFDNIFSDSMRVLWQDDQKQWHVYQCQWTTLAGTKGRGGEQNPLNGWQTGTGVDGVAIIIPMQYRNVYKFVDNSFFLGAPHFAQIGNMLYWRDNNRDGIVTKGKVYEGNYSTLIHNMSNPSAPRQEWVNSDNVTWSIGCQGTNYYNYMSFVDIVRQSAKRYGNTFSCTLFDAEQIPA